MTERSSINPKDQPSGLDPFDGPRWVESTHNVDLPIEHRSGHTRARVSRRRRRRQRRARGIFTIAGAFVVLAGAWLIATGLMARDQLTQVRAAVRTLRADISVGNFVAARAVAADIATHAHRAHQLTEGPVWALAADLPAAGDPLRTARGIAAGVDAVGQSALPRLVTASDDVNPAALRGGNGTINMAPLTQARPVLDAASATLLATQGRVRALPGNTWMHPINGARNDLLTQLDGLRRTVQSADLAARLAPPMLGAEGRKHYFLAFQNNAEARGTGGLPGAFAIVEADHGKVAFTEFHADSTLWNVSTGLNFGPAYEQLYGGAETTSKYVNTNLSPNFPYAAQTWLAMWRKVSGQHLDGAIAVDPATLSDLLAVTGPVVLPDRTQVSAANVVALTQSTVYAKFPASTASDQQARKAYLLEVASGASKKILDSRTSATALVRAAGKAAGERRLLVWSADPNLENELKQTSVSGIIPSTTAPYVGMSIVNDGGNKLDYYLDRQLNWQRSGCGSTRRTTVTITLTNNAPATGLSPYVTSRSDIRSYPVRPGDSRLEVAYLATQGALMDHVTVDGRPGTAAIGREQGHPVYTVDLELPRGTTRTIVLELMEPATPGDPIVLRQPLVRPLSVTLSDARCG